MSQLTAPLSALDRYCIRYGLETVRQSAERICAQLDHHAHATEQAIERVRGYTVKREPVIIDGQCREVQG